MGPSLSQSVPLGDARNPQIVAERPHVDAPRPTTLMRITEETVRALPVGKPIPILPALQRITFDVIMKTVFGACDVREGRTESGKHRRQETLLEGYW